MMINSIKRTNKKKNVASLHQNCLIEKWLCETMIDNGILHQSVVVWSSSKWVPSSRDYVGVYQDDVGAFHVNSDQYLIYIITLSILFFIHFTWRRAAMVKCILFASLGRGMKSWRNSFEWENHQVCLLLDSDKKLMTQHSPKQKCVCIIIQVCRASVLNHYQELIYF